MTILLVLTIFFVVLIPFLFYFTVREVLKQLTKNNMNKISESIIVTYAKALRRIQTEQVDPYIELIEKELIKLYPELKDREDNA